MPRVVLFATDPNLSADSLTEQLATWVGAPLEVVLVSLHPVPGTLTDRGEQALSGTARDAAQGGLVGRSYEEDPAAEAPGSTQPSRPGRKARAADVLRAAPVALLSSAKRRRGPAGQTPRAAGPSSRALRLRAEAAARARGVKLWEHVSTDEVVAHLVSRADAVAAVDPGGIRTAFNVARANPDLVATNGLVPCLIELDARAQTSLASRTSSVVVEE